MIINTDAKSLEWCTYLYFSQDKIGIPEWNNVIQFPDKYEDIHTGNQNTFNLPSRLIAKILLFRSIYADPTIAAFAFSKDPNFASVSKSVKFWEQKLEAFFSKYKDLKKTHNKFIQLATTQGQITIPTGRVYNFEPKLHKGELKWPISDILNWPNQGLGAEIMAIARIVTKIGMKKRNIKGHLISTVHDSIVFDSPASDLIPIATLMKDVFYHLPHYINKFYGIDWNIIMLGETSYGPNMANLKEIIV